VLPALYAAKSGAIPAGQKCSAIEGTDLKIQLSASPVFRDAADTPAVLVALRAALKLHFGQHLHCTSGLIKGAYMRATFHGTPEARRSKRQLAAEGCFRFQLSGLDVNLPVCLVPGVLPPDHRVMVAKFPPGELLHSDFWQTVLRCAGYGETGGNCTASFLPSHAGGPPDDLDGSKIIAYAVPPPGDPTFRHLPRFFTYDGDATVQLLVGDHENVVREPRAPLGTLGLAPVNEAPEPAPSAGPRTAPAGATGPRAAGALGPRGGSQAPPDRAPLSPPGLMPRPDPHPHGPASSSAPGPICAETVPRRDPSARHATRDAPPLVAQAPALAHPSGAVGKPTARPAATPRVSLPSSGGLPQPPPLTQLPVRVSDVDLSPLTDALFYWAQENAGEASHAQLQSTVLRLRQEQPALWTGSWASNTVPRCVQDAFLTTLVHVAPTAAKSARQAMDHGYDSAPSTPRTSSPARTGMDVDAPWVTVTNKRKDRQASTSGVTSRGRPRRRATGTRRSPPPSNARAPAAGTAVEGRRSQRASLPRAAHSQSRMPFWASPAATSVSTPASAFGGAPRHVAR
jgi:hypothetical protein